MRQGIEALKNSISSITTYVTKQVWPSYLDLEADLNDLGGRHPEICGRQIGV
jgi:hypothetical protein